LFGIANIGAWGTFVFYDSLLPHVAHSDAEMDRASTAGYALGYLGGGLMLALNLAWISWPAAFGFEDSAAAARGSFLSVALWWVIFSIPLFRRVPEPAVRGGAGTLASLASVPGLARRLRQTFRDLRRRREALLFLLAFLVYNDGIGTVIRMAAIYGAEIGLPQDSLLAAILLVQLIGVPCALAFGGLAVRVGIKPAILFSLAVYLGITVIGALLSRPWHFYVLAVLVGSVQGGSQALSRSLFARLIPRARSAEFFAFFSISDKVAGVLGPAVFAGVSSLAGSSRMGVMIVGVFFVAGALLLTRVDVEAGERAAAAEDREACTVGEP
jgi:UMF1 family MFS transporter